MSSLVAVDLGAQSGRVALGVFDGARLSVREVHRFPNLPVRTRGTLSWDILRIYGDVLDGLRAAARETSQVDSVAVDSWAIDFGLIDRQGRLLQNPVHYRDGRRARATDDVLACVPARELYERTGIQHMPINTVFELGAMVAERDAALGIAEKLLLIPDLVHYWLCGAQTSEFTNATTTQCFDPRKGGWATDLMERLGVPTALFPEVVQPGTELGHLSNEVAQETGLGGTEVVAVATHDTGSAVAAVPFRQRGGAFISAGTWSLVGLEVPAPVISDASFAANLTNEGGIDGSFRLLRNVTGLWLLHECKRAWELEERHYTFEELGDLAEAAPALRAFIEPNDPTFAAPGEMPARVRAYCAGTGQPEPDEPGSVVRCILESLALKHAQVIDTLTSVTGTAPSAIHIVGGGARNEMLCRWTAAAAGLPVLVGPEEATVLGNMLVQAMALGEIGSPAEAREVVRTSFETREYEPVETAEWQEARARFAGLSSEATSEVTA